VLTRYVNAITSRGCRVHLEACLLKDRVKQIADVVVILNYHGHAKFAHDYPISGKTTASPSAMR
jgi:hypothetical protein